ncbi:MAG: 2-dehydropantoate 2-reductase [Motiliproteus sp.]|nr:2-dehydropantoate 2-reductase [Motiliproteus sp.]
MTSSDSQSWHILGAGAVGSLWANYLLRNKQPVCILCRSPEQLDAFWDNPFLTLVVDGQRYKSQPKTELFSSNQPIHKLLVTTKSYDTLEAIQSVAHRIDRSTQIVVLQNGMGNQQSVAELFPNSAVYAGTTTEGAYRTGPHQVVHAGRGKTWFGPFNKAANDQGGEPLQALLDLDLVSDYEDSIHTRLWQKLAINCAINGLTAIHDCRNGKLLESPYLEEMIQLCDEVELVAAKLNQPLFPHPLIDAAKGVAKATGENLSSMLQDVRHQRQTEISSINGFLCRQAEQLSIPVPHNQQLTERVLKLSAEQDQ